jgi:hypothetical protein
MGEGAPHVYANTIGRHQSAGLAPVSVPPGMRVF